MSTAALASPAVPVDGGALAEGARESEACFIVSGIHCAACSITIEQALRRLPGVLMAEVNGSNARLRLRWDPMFTGEAAWAAALAPAGYTLAPDQAAPARALRRAEARALTWRLFVAALCSMQVMMLAAPSYGAAPGEIEPGLAQVLAWGQWVLTLPAMLFSAGPLLRGAWAGLTTRRLVMDVPVALGLLVAFVASSAATFDPTGPFGGTLYFDSATMFVALLLGARRFELHLRHRAAEQLEAAATLLPEQVLKLAADGTATPVPLASLRVGDHVRVPLGEAVPADGVLLGTADAALDEALLSGESLPRARRPGEALWAGSVNRGAPLEMQVQRCGSGTRLAAMQQLLREAQTRRPASMRMADRWAGPFVAAVLLAALAAGLAWSLADPLDPRHALEVAMTVLIVTCPCALSLAVPLTQMAAAQRLAREGVVVQRLEGLERLAEADRVVFDKTGTLTATTADAAAGAGVRLHRLEARLGSADDEPAALWPYAAALGAASHHPIARAIAAASPVPAAAAFSQIEEAPGRGLLGVDAAGRRWRLGSAAWTGAPASDASARAWLSCDEQVLAAFAIDEALRDGADTVVAALRQEGLVPSLASGDAAARVQALADRLAITDVLAAASPEAKLAHLATRQRAGHVVVAVGDGFNDGPLLAQADVAVAMSHGAAASQREAHLLLDSARPAVLQGLLAARRVAVRARAIARQNLAWAAAYNAACIPLALAGWLPPWAAGLGMATSSLAVLLNAARLNR